MCILHSMAVYERSLLMHVLLRLDLLKIALISTVSLCVWGKESTGVHREKSIAPFAINIVEKVKSAELVEEQLKSYIPPKEYHLVVVIPSYNNAEWYKLNLDSVFAQDYKNFSVVYVDDASSDRTGSLVQKYITEKKQEHKTTLILNKERQGACANWYKAINMLPPDVVVISIDGDDWLAKPTVLSLINKIYNKYECLLTYGSYQVYPKMQYKFSNDKQLPNYVIKNSKYRSYRWTTSHLRTFKAGLFQRIEKKDLEYKGKFFFANCDLGIMFPMLEMAGDRSVYVPDVLYIYNRATSLNDSKVLKTHSPLSWYIRGHQKRYTLLPPGVAY